MICQYCGSELQTNGCINPACPGRLRPTGESSNGSTSGQDSTLLGPAPVEVERLVDRINDELFCGALKRETKSRLLAALTNKGENLSGDVIVPVEKLEAGRYRMMIPVEISTTGGLLLDRRDGLHGYSLEDYPNARFFKGWAGAPNRKAGE